VEQPVVAAGQWRRESEQLESLARLALLAAKSQAELLPATVAEQQHAAVLLRPGAAYLPRELLVQQEGPEAAAPGLAAGAAARSSAEPARAVAAQEAPWARRASSQQQAAQELDAAELRWERPAAWR
jgi:hypothetical protein